MKTFRISSSNKLLLMECDSDGAVSKSKESESFKRRGSMYVCKYSYDSRVLTGTI